VENTRQLSETLMKVAVEWGGRVVGVLVALFLAWVIGGWLRRVLLRSLDRRGIDATLSRFFANIVRYAVIAGATIGCLGAFGIQTASFAALIAALGLAIGLAFQGTLSNFAAGAMLLIFRPFRVGDFIRAAGEFGTVEELELFTTELKTPDNRRLIIPNGRIFGDVIENFSHHETRRVEVPVGVAYGADLDKTRDILVAALRQVPGVLEDPEPMAFLSDLGDSSVNWKLRVWAKSTDFWDVHQAVVRTAKQALDAAHISIPFPQMDVHLER
jgi:small conductance mechanosensitive channel